MKVLILGGSGMLGHKLVQVLDRRFEIWSTIRSTYNSVAAFGIFDRDRTIEGIDAMKFETVVRAIEISRPDVVINAVGIVKQKEMSKNVVTALSVNSIFPQLLIEIRKSFGFRFITISTDCVFSGSKGYYCETDAVDAIDLYGQSKHWGEVEDENCLTIRTSIIGRELGIGHGLLEWFIVHRNRQVPGYANAVFSGFPTAILADIIGEISESYPELSGIFHISSDPISKFELLSKINTRFGLGVTVEKFDDLAIDRSLDSSKFRRATGFQPLSWDEMIDAMAADPTPYNKWNNQSS